jgi:hypothetical protein
MISSPTDDLEKMILHPAQMRRKARTRFSVCIPTDAYGINAGAALEHDLNDIWRAMMEGHS